MLSLRNIDSLYTHLTMSPKWEKTILFFIVVYAVWIGVEIEMNPNVTEERDPDAVDVFYIVEVGFTLLFVCELWARVKAYKQTGFFFTEKERWRWNVFDLVLVLLMVGENLVMPFIEGVDDVKQHLPRLTTLRLLRLIRLVRILIIVPELAMLIRSLVGALRSVASMGVLIMLFLYVFAATFTIWHHDRDPHNEDEDFY